MYLSVPIVSSTILVRECHNAPEQRTLVAQLPELFLSTIVDTFPLAESLLLRVDNVVSPHEDCGRNDTNVQIAHEFASLTKQKIVDVRETKPAHHSSMAVVESRRVVVDE